jgi:primosomal protein N' (replication factor Y) (superfamily II helicase)
VAIEVLSKKYGAHLLKTDALISLRDTGESVYKKLDSVDLSSRVDLIDMTNIPQTTEEKLANKFTLLSKELLSNTKTYLRSGHNVFWFVSRRGLFPGTVCRDCGREHVCPQCDSSLVLHQSKGSRLESHKLTGDPGRFFLCHRCSRREDALVTCRNCNSWRLMPLGIGVERVAEEVRTLGINPLIISQDTTPTKKSVEEVKALYNDQSREGKLLIGTDLAIPVVRSGVVFSGVVSMDSRLALPSYIAEESALRTLLTVASLTKEYCIIQTRRPQHRIFKHRNGQALNSFRSEEMEMRRSFLYPPAGTLLEISFVAKKDTAEERLASLLSDIKPLLSSNRESAVRFPLRGIKKVGYYKAILVVRILGSLNEHRALREYVLLLSPSITVRIDPENL